MATVKISLEGSKKIRIEGPRDFLFFLRDNVPGVNVAKGNRLARFYKDEIVYLFVRKWALEWGDCFIDPEVSAWAREEANQAKHIARIKSIVDAELDIPYQDTLRQYQRVDVAAMKDMRRLILGNEPGTGKTLEAIAYCDEIDARRILVVCSKSLMGGWEQEINKWSTNPDTTIVPVESNYKRKEKMLANFAENSRFTIINYEMLRDDYFFPIWAHKWDVVICDEAHRLKGRETQQTAGLSKVRTESLILATGTWITNNHQEVFQLLKLVDPDRFSSYWQFVERFCEVETNYFNKKAKDVVGPKNMNAYKYMMNKYLIQRRKRDVLPELPEVIHKIVPIQLTTYQKKHYDELLKEMLTEFTGEGVEEDLLLATPTVLSQYTKLRQLVLTPKLIGGKDSTNKTQAIIDIIENTDEQVVVFSWFKKYIVELDAALAKKKIPFYSIHGDVSAADRSSAELGFRKGKRKVMLGSIKAMSEGLNLQTASVMIFSDKSYVPADNEQAIARIDRMGQKQSPLVYHLNTVNTIEGQIEKILSQKQDLIDEATAIEEVIKRLAKR